MPHTSHYNQGHVYVPRRIITGSNLVDTYSYTKKQRSWALWKIMCFQKINQTPISILLPCEKIHSLFT